ncbi:TnsA endonuclease-like protein [Azospirillum brasilense]|uniref:TnsA endonuclease-like protein n=1 Tax=Azospirillum brasilense TaxID=192 RepID=A0A560B1I3_AZOBR|nr:TnsA endonuclease N-terminal domain-containing protein [Azospirillum brasilense]TWA66471.1 TnsA endonuclease-like protein [Azospirillum brasilense]
MARRRYAFDEDKIALFHKEGRGKGRGADYKPWLTVQDVPSSGRTHRLRGLKTGRQHHLLSDIEWRFFLLFDWADDVEDIREQFPLDRATTRRIADEMGVRHPTGSATKVHVVMTTDLVVDVVRDGRLVTLARTVKPSAELAKPRILEKLEIERRYWAEQRIGWGILTEKEVPMSVATSILWVHSYGYLDNLSQPYPGYYEEKATLIRRELPSWPGQLPLGRFCTEMDNQLGMERGVALFLVRYLLATKDIRCDMAQPLDDSVPLHRFEAAPIQRTRTAG